MYSDGAGTIGSSSDIEEIVDSAITSLENSIELLQPVVNDVDQLWEGVDADKYLSDLRNAITNYENTTKEAVKKYGNMLVQHFHDWEDFQQRGAN